MSVTKLCPFDTLGGTGILRNSAVILWIYTMSEIKPLNAVVREGVGKGAARSVRRAGQVPAVIYGAGLAPQPVSLDYNQTKQLIYAGHFLTTIFEIDVNGQKTQVIPRDYQLDPVRDFPLHVDFLRLSKGQKIKVEVPVHVIGQETSPGVKRGGAVQIVEHSIELMVPADKIPDSIEISVSKLDIGSSIHLKDVQLPEGAKAVSQEDLTLISLIAPTGFKEEIPAEAAPAAVPAKAPAKAAKS